MDCVQEDETYLLTKTNFYDECDVNQDGDESIDKTLADVSTNTCFANRRCQAAGDEPYPGYDPSGNCTCQITQYEPPPSSYTSQATRLKRQTGEFISATKPLCRTFRAKKGGKRK